MALRGVLLGAMRERISMIMNRILASDGSMLITNTNAQSDFIHMLDETELHCN